SNSNAALLRVDITRRNPLAGKVASPLPDLVPDFDADESVAPTSPGMPPVNLDLPDVPEESETDTAPRPMRGRRPRNTTTPAPVDTEDAGYGDDNADWA